MNKGWMGKPSFRQLIPFGQDVSLKFRSYFVDTLYSVRLYNSVHNNNL